MLWLELMPLDKVKEVGFSADFEGCRDIDFEGGGCKGASGGVADVDCFKGDDTGGGGGGGADGEFGRFPKAFRAACMATD